jgi:hypothetical protein
MTELDRRNKIFVGEGEFQVSHTAELSNLDTCLRHDTSTKNNSRTTTKGELTHTMAEVHTPGLLPRRYKAPYLCN